METLKKINMLLVEDNPGDARLAIEVMKEGKIINEINHAIDGQDAIDFLFKRNNYKDVDTPDLIILDLNLPKKDGFEVLAEIKTHKRLQSIPIVIFTMSTVMEDIIKSYDLHANCYITKPLDLDNFIYVVKSLQDFWLTIVKLPTKN